MFFNISHLCPVFLPASGCPRRSLLALHTCCAPCLFYLYFLFFFTEQLCSSLPLSDSLPDYCCLVIFFPFLCQKPPGKSLSGSRWTLFLRLSYSKWLIPTSFPKSFICFVRKRKEAFKKSPAFRVKFFSRVNLRAAQ